VHRICEFYKKIYLLAPRISKKDRFGIFSKIENLCLEAIDLIISASLEIRQNKYPILTLARIKIEVLKRLVRICRELDIIEEKRYLAIELDLQEISKMTNGWMKYLK
jgi:hypothetical protein